MVKISDITSNDGDQNKKPQEEENQNEKPKPQQAQNLPRPQQAQNLRIPEDIPDVINELILSLLERCDYPSLLCTSKAFRDIITSPGLFETRSRLGRTESVLYALIGFSEDVLSRWYILPRRNNSLRLSMIKSLPPLIPGSAVVTIGHDIYIFGGKLKQYPPLSTVIVIDCRFHTWRPLPDMRRARHNAAAGVIDGKIYVIGGCTNQYDYWAEVFDVNKETWENVPHPDPNSFKYLDGGFGACVVMKGYIYILNGTVTGGCLAYVPALGQWEYRGMRTPPSRFWKVSSCVVDDMLYSIDHKCFFGYPIVVYDPTDMVWRPVKGVQSYDLFNLAYPKYKMANLGRKLVIFACYRSLYIWEKDIWCIVIALETRENGEIWGNVESKSSVFSSNFKSPLLEHSPTVTL